MSQRGESPILSRRQLGSELRRLRERTGLTGLQVAEQLECDTGKIYRIESGKQGIRPKELRELLGYYDITDPQQVEEYVSWAKAGKRPGWWKQYRDLISVPYTELEAAASRILWLENQLVPGLLQTDGYSRALIEAESPDAHEEEVLRRLKIRNERQVLLFNDAEPCQLQVLIDEAVLMRPVGSPQIMGEQLDHLVSSVQRSNVHLEVIPFDVGVHGSLGVRFVLLQFEDPSNPGVVLLEQIHWKEELIEDSAVVARFSDTFSRLRTVAANEKRSLALIKRARDNFLSK